MKLKFTLPVLLVILLVQTPFSQDLFRSFTEGDSTRPYLIYVPFSFDNQEPRPLIIDLHRYEEEDGTHRGVGRWWDIADTANFIVAFPQGLTVDASDLEFDPDLGLPEDGTGWNTGGSLSANDDVSFISNMIDHLHTDFNIDLSRVYITGHGLGGAMAQYLACELSDRIAAVASIAGPLPKSNLFNCSFTEKKPFMFVHGTEDEYMPYGGNDAFMGAEETIAFWTDNNGCAADSMVTMLPDANPNDNSTITLKTFSDCEDNTEVRLYRVEGGGHTWPGGGTTNQSGLGNINFDITASVEMWNFFKNYTLPDPAPANDFEGYGSEKWTLEFVQQGDVSRRSIVYIPEGFNNDNDNWPLVLNIHAPTSNGSEQLAISGMGSVADTGHFIVALPYGSPDPVGDGFVWNDILDPDGADDLGFLTTLIDNMTADYAIDPCRVYSAGFAGGGSICYLLACESPERIAAIASLSGPMPTAGPWDCQSGQPVPVLHMHGTADPAAPIGGGTGALGIEFPAVRDIIGNWLDNNGCVLDSTIVEFPDVPGDNTTVSRREFTNCTTYYGPDGIERSSEVWYYIIEGGSISWPPLGIFGNGNLDIDGSTEVWNFFKRHYNSGNMACITATHDLNASDIALRAYPNPASTQLNFEFELPEAATVTITLYNALGQTLHVLTDETLQAGAQQISWQRPNTVPDGLYFYQLQIGDKMVSESVVLGR